MEVRSRPLFSGNGVTSAGEGSEHVLPYSISGPNSETCPPTSFLCIPHLSNHADLFRKQAGTSTGQTGPGSGHTESWQGLPPQMISTGGNAAPSSVVMSPTCVIRGKRRWVTEMGKGSISLAHRGSTPQRTAARGNPPMPSKRLPIVSVHMTMMTSYHDLATKPDSSIWISGKAYRIQLNLPMSGSEESGGFVIIKLKYVNTLLLYTYC